MAAKWFTKKPNTPAAAQKDIQYVLGDIRAKVFFGVVFFILAVLLVITFQPYGGALVLALLLAALLHPVYRYLHRKLKWSPRYITTLIIVGLLVFTLVPLFFILQNLAREAISTSNAINTYISSGQINEFAIKIQSLLAKVHINVNSSNVSTYALQALEKFSGELASTATGIIKNLFSFFVSLSLFFAALVFLIPRMSSIKRVALEISPLGKAITSDYIEKTRLLLKGAVVGSFMISLTASTIMGITFYLLHIPNALLFATVAFILGFIPYLGTAIFTFGAAIIFAVLGEYNQAAILLIVQIVFLNQLDLVFRPITVPKKVRIHPALMIIAVLSGLATFGILGIIFGPVILVLFISTVEIYRQNYGHKPSTV